jgi:hypothetical protein
MMPPTIHSCFVGYISRINLIFYFLYFITMLKTKLTNNNSIVKYNVKTSFLGWRQCLFIT